MINRNFKEKIKAMCERPHVFGVASSEDIYWSTIGYCFAEKNYSKELNANLLMSEFSGYLFLKFSGNHSDRNWGVLLRLISENNIESILIFKELFLKFEGGKNIEANSNRNTGNSFIETLKILSNQNIFDNTLQLERFLIGYELAYEDFGVKDNEYELYRKNKASICDKILKELNVPLYLNAMFQLFSRYYATPNEAVNIFLSKTISILI